MPPTVRSALVIAAFAVFPATMLAQQGGAQAPSRTPPKEASQFDFLIGQWELVVKPQAVGLAARIHGGGKFAGVWKAWRALDGWGLEDELRITDASGNPAGLSRALRAYDAAASHWNSTGIDAYRAVVSGSTAEFKNGVMTLSGHGVDQDGKPYLSRSTFSAITATSFIFTQWRSLDDGKSWGDPGLIIDAKRVAAAAPR